MGSLLQELAGQVSGHVVPVVAAVMVLAPLLVLTVFVCVVAVLALRAPDRGSREHSLRVLDLLIGYGRDLRRRR